MMDPRATIALMGRYKPPWKPTDDQAPWNPHSWMRVVILNIGPQYPYGNSYRHTFLFISNVSLLPNRKSFTQYQWFFKQNVGYIGE